MFFGVGYKEHLIVVECAPYGEGVFAGAVEVMSVSSEQKLAMLFGEREQLDVALMEWDAGITEVGELFLKANVAMLMDNPLRPMLRAPALFMAEGEQVKCIPCEEEKPYSLCHPGDEDTPSMKELGLAIQDYEKDTRNDPALITEHIARFIHATFNLPDAATIRYLNFKTGTLFKVVNEQPTTH